MGLGEIVAEFRKKIWKLKDGRLYIDGIYMEPSEIMIFVKWIKDNFK